MYPTEEEGNQSTVNALYNIVIERKAQKVQFF